MTLMELDSFSDSRQLNAAMVIKTCQSRELYLCVDSKICIL